jgi:hypothetical protein
VLERSSTPVAAADRLGWKDTVGVLPDETVTDLAWFAPYPGKYVFHCHALEHAGSRLGTATRMAMGWCPVAQEGYSPPERRPCSSTGVSAPSAPIVNPDTLSDPQLAT